MKIRVKILNDRINQFSSLWQSIYSVREHIALENMIKIGPDNGLLHDGTKTSPQPMLTYHQWDIVEFAWEQFAENSQDVYIWCKFQYYWLRIIAVYHRGADELIKSKFLIHLSFKTLNMTVITGTTIPVTHFTSNHWSALKIVHL